MEREQPKVQNVVAIFTVINALLGYLFYLQGRMFHDGYLSTWGIPPELFHATIDEHISFGFIAYALIVSKPIAKITLWSFVVFEILFFMDMVADGGHFGRFFKLNFFKKKRQECKDKNNHNESESDFKLLFRYSKKFSFFSFVVLIVFLCTIIVVSLSGKKGEEFAASEIEKYTRKIDSDTFIPQELYVKDCNIKINPIKGIFVTSSKDYSAIYDGKQIIIVPSSEFDHIITPLPQNNQNENLKRQKESSLRLGR